MTKAELAGYINKVHATATDAEITDYLNEASRDFLSQTKILKGTISFTTTEDLRNYSIDNLVNGAYQDEIFEIYQVDMDGFTMNRLINSPDEVDLT
tara:strand:+ start:8015 stop:8302 length:288 start_codon:yes stop_codon:yes gene_type:complete